MNEIEAVVEELPGVAKAVAAVQDKRLAIFMVLEPDAGPAPQDLQVTVKQLCSARLPPYMVPSAVITIDQIPLSANGKVDRSKLPKANEMLSASSASASTGGGPASPTEQLVLNIAATFFGSDCLHMAKDFFECGGNSFLAVRLVTLLNKEFGSNLNASDVLRYRTLRCLAAQIHAAPSLTPNVLPLTPNRSAGGESIINIFLVHGVGGTAFAMHELARAIHAQQPNTMVYGLQTSLAHDENNSNALSMQQIAASYFDQMRIIQPCGPYNLAGWSFGGHVCFEIAMMCIREGRGSDVSSLLLIDTFAAQFQFEHAPPDSAIVQQFVSDLMAEHGAGNCCPPPFFCEIDKALTFLQRQVLPDDQSSAGLMQIFRSYRQNTQVLWNYNPIPLTEHLECSPVLIKAVSVLAEFGETYQHAEAYDLGWRALMPTIQVIECPGNHYSMVTEPSHAQHLAQQMLQIVNGQTSSQSAVNTGPADDTEAMTLHSESTARLVWELQTGNKHWLLINASEHAADALAVDHSATTSFRILAAELCRQSELESLIGTQRWALVIQMLSAAQPDVTHLLSAVQPDHATQIMIVFAEAELSGAQRDRAKAVVLQLRSQNVEAHLVRLRHDNAESLLPILLRYPSTVIGLTECMITPEALGAVVSLPNVTSTSLVLHSLHSK